MTSCNICNIENRVVSLENMICALEKSTSMESKISLLNRISALEDRIATLEQKNKNLETMTSAQAVISLDKSKEMETLRHRIRDLEKPKHESHYQSLLEKQLKGKHLHIKNVGTTDITTEDSHVEIKRWTRYHEVPGQLSKYNQACPRMRKCVYFFGPPPSSQKMQDILKLMTSQGIEMYSFDADDEIITHVLETNFDVKVKSTHEIESDSLKKFLSDEDQVIFSEGSRVDFQTLKKAFEAYVGKTVSAKLDRGSFSQANSAFKIDKVKICRSCKSTGGKGCCDNYSNANRTTKQVVVNLKLVKEIE